MLNGPHIVFAAGGPLGNVYPGLSIAREVLSLLPHAQVTFVGDGGAAGRHLVRGEGYQYVAMPGKPAPTGPMEAVRFVTDNVAGFWASRWMVREQQVSLVVGLGGSAGGAMVRAAHGRGIPYVLLEPNAVASRTTRRMAHSAEAVCSAFEAVRPHLPVDAPFVLTGVPGRPAFHALHEQIAPARRRAAAGESFREKRLVVIGGAGGARWLNESAPEALAGLGSELEGWQVVHQTGEGQLRETEDRYRSRGVPALVVSYIDEMASLLAETDLVVCQAGGTMLAELALAGAPAVLVPVTDAADRTQQENAAVYAEATGCPIIEPSSAPQGLAAALQHEVRPLLVDTTRRHQMAAAAMELAQPEAAGRIAEILCDCLCGGQSRMAA